MMIVLRFVLLGTLLVLATGADNTLQPTPSSNVQSRVSELEGEPWTRRARGVLDFIGNDAAKYVTESRRLFALLLPNAHDRAIAYRALTHVGSLSQNLFTNAGQAIIAARAAYARHCTHGPLECAERATSAVLDRVVPSSVSDSNGETQEPSSREEEEVRVGRKPLWIPGVHAAEAVRLGRKQLWYFSPTPVPRSSRDTEEKVKTEAKITHSVVPTPWSKPEEHQPKKGRYLRRERDWPVIPHWVPPPQKSPGEPLVENDEIRAASVQFFVAEACDRLKGVACIAKRKISKASFTDFFLSVFVAVLIAVLIILGSEGYSRLKIGNNEEQTTQVTSSSVHARNSKDAYKTQEADEDREQFSDSGQEEEITVEEDEYIDVSESDRDEKEDNVDEDKRSKDNGGDEDEEEDEDNDEDEEEEDDNDDVEYVATQRTRRWQAPRARQVPSTRATRSRIRSGRS